MAEDTADDNELDTQPCFVLLTHLQGHKVHAHCVSATRKLVSNATLQQSGGYHRQCWQLCLVLACHVHEATTVWCQVVESPADVGQRAQEGAHDPETPYSIAANTSLASGDGAYPGSLATVCPQNPSSSGHNKHSASIGRPVLYAAMAL